MARKQQEYNICPKCGTKTSPTRTWQLIAPLPDSQGRITITIMGVYECSNCGYKWRGVVSKMKVGSNSIEIESGKKGIKLLGDEKNISSRQGNIIELDLDEILAEEE